MNYGGLVSHLPIPAILDKTFRLVPTTRVGHDEGRRAEAGAEAAGGRRTAPPKVDMAEAWAPKGGLSARGPVEESDLKIVDSQH